MSAISRKILFIGILILAIPACNLPVAAPTANPDAVFTGAAQTVAASVNQTLAPTLTFTPSADTFTPAPTISPTAEFTSTPSIPLITVSVNTNCRVGPGKVYEPPVGGLLVGQTGEIYGKNAAGTYWYIRLPNSNTYCWVTGEYATVVGNTAVLPVFTPPPTPTPPPSFDLAYAGLDSCVGWWIEVKLKNTGPVAFLSYAMTVRDIDTAVTLTASGNGFTDLGGCLTSSIVASLTPGESYTLSGPAFAYDPSGHRIRAAVTLCTQANQGGQCVSQTIEFKP